MNTVKYPEIYVRLVHEDGNAYSILARVTSAMKRGALTQDEIEEFFVQATSSTYDHLLRTVMDYVSVDWDMPRKDDDTEDDDDDDLFNPHCGWCGELHEDCECDDE